VAALALAWLSLAATAVPHDRATAKHNFTHHVRPIFEKHCASCHVPGGIAPMSLMKYDDASPWAAAIRTEVLERRMPPWQPEEGIGMFHGSRYLSAKEIDIIVDWATGGTPQGDPLPLPPAQVPDAVWTLGPPDRVIDAETTTVAADDMEETKCLPISLPNRPLRAFDFQPGNPEMVHRATISTSCDSKSMPLANWLPGQSPVAAPAGYAWPPAQKLFLTIFYRKTWRHDGKELRDQSRIGLYFADPSAKRVRTLRVAGTYRADAAMRLISIYAAEAQRVEVGGEPILQIDRFDPAWNGKYVFSEPLAVSKGTVISGNVWLEYF
jgi:mono/diheme cytochrome c family protein